MATEVAHTIAYIAGGAVGALVGAFIGGGIIRGLNWLSRKLWSSESVKVNIRKQLRRF